MPYADIGLKFQKNHNNMFYLGDKIKAEAEEYTLYPVIYNKKQSNLFRFFLIKNKKKIYLLKIIRNVIIFYF